MFKHCGASEIRLPIMERQKDGKGDWERTREKGKKKKEK